MIGPKCSVRYRIRIEGEINSTWSDRLGGLCITTDPVEPGMVTTTALEGELMDNSALAGVLATLHTLNVTLVSVERLGDSSEEADND